MWSAALALAVSITQSASLPDAFVGKWKGEMIWTSAGSTEPKKVQMNLRIEKTKLTGTYDYHLVYGDKAQDSRPYKLKLIDANKGHWQIDEQNGILLDEYLINGVFHGSFSVQGNLINTSLRPESGRLISEMVTLEETPLKSTNALGVKTYRVKSTQRAVLTREKS